jgi:hypothetical protein
LFYKEPDVLPALALNGLLGLGGLSYKKFAPFREKGAMCSKMSQAGIRTPRFRVVDTLLDFFEFARVEGYPFLIKPSLSYAALGIRIMDSKDSLEEFCRSLPSSAFQGRNLNFICQQLIDVKTTYMVNGMVSGGEVRCCYPVRPEIDLLKSFSSSSVFWHFPCVEVHPNCSMFSQLTKLTVRVIDAFEVPPGATFAYHLEVMEDQDGELWFCEIACRVGGLTHYVEWTGIDLFGASFYGQLGIVHESIPKNLALQPKRGDDVSAVLLLGISAGTTLKLIHDFEYGDLNAERINKKPRYPLPYTAPLIRDLVNGAMTYWKIDGKNSQDIRLKITDLISRQEKAFVIEVQNEQVPESKKENLKENE